MNKDNPDQELGILYLRKKAQFNEYTEFKNKSFQYQKTMGKLHYICSSEDQQNSKKQIKKLLKVLEMLLQDLKNIFSQINEEMKFLKLASISLLLEIFEQLICSLHHYNIQEKKRKIQFDRKQGNEQNRNSANTCKKCLEGIKQMNFKKLYDEITTTDGLELKQNQAIMTKQERRIMINELDEYDVIIAEKESYLRKVSNALENKGKIVQLSNTNKNYNFLSQYLATIEKIQTKKAKSSHLNGQEEKIIDEKWEEQSYKHILQYMKRVLFDHFLNECSGPVKKLFQKINIDRIFKPFENNLCKGDYNSGQERKDTRQKCIQTVPLNQIDQLKFLQKKMQFKLRQAKTLKENKQQLQKKYIAALDLNRQIEGELFDIKKQKKWIEAQFTMTQDNLQTLNQSLQSKIESMNNQKIKYFENHYCEKEKLIRISKKLQSDIQFLENQVKKYNLKKKNHPLSEINSQETQTNTSETENKSFNEIKNQNLLRSEVFFRKKKKSINPFLFTALKSQRRDDFGPQSQRPSQYQIFNNLLNHNLEQSNRIIEEKKAKFVIDSFLLSETILPVNNAINHEDKLQEQQIESKRNEKDNSNFILNKKKTSKYIKTEDSNYTQETNFIKTSNTMLPFIESGRLLKKKNTTSAQNKMRHELSDDSKIEGSHKKLIRNNRMTELNDNSVRDNSGQIVKQNAVKENLKKKCYQVSQRLYLKRTKDTKQNLFQRVIEKGKEKFYIKKISRQSIKYKAEKQRMKQISQILKPYVYNNNRSFLDGKRKEYKNTKSVRQRLSEFNSGQVRYSTDDNYDKSFNQDYIDQKVISTPKTVKVQQINFQGFENNHQEKKIVGRDILVVQHVIESEFAYLKAVGFIDFILKIGKDNKKSLNAPNKVQSHFKHKFSNPTESDLVLFGGLQEAEDYIKRKNFWNIENVTENLMIYNKNDSLSCKAQRYMNLLKKANREIYVILMNFLIDPISTVFNKNSQALKQLPAQCEDFSFVKDLFNQLQKYHKIRHSQCTHITDFLQKIGFYRYSYF